MRLSKYDAGGWQEARYVLIIAGLMFVYVHLYNTVEIISPSFLKSMYVGQLTNYST